MNKEVVKRVDAKPKGGVYHRMIFGLNIFDAVPIKQDLTLNPQLEFLRQITSRFDVAVSIGSLSDYADSPEDLLGTIDFEPVRIGCYGGNFYDNAKWAEFPAIFLSGVSADFFSVLYAKESLIMKILVLDAMALFVLPRIEDAGGHLLEVLNGPFESSDNIIQKTTELFDLVILSEDDGNYFSAFTKNSETFELLNESLDSAVGVIEQSRWFQEHQADLVWDDDYSGCLRLREDIPFK